MGAKHQDTSLGGQDAHFIQTAWGVIQRACDPSPEVRRGGLEDLCRSYWKPVYHYLRVAWAKSNEDAKDLTQAFFLWLADPQALQRYEAERGSFRSFLKSLLRHFVQHHDEALARLKRGGGHTILTLDGPGFFVADPHSATPEEAFEKEWREAVIDQAFERVRSVLQESGHEKKFRAFEEYYLNVPPGGRQTYASIAEKLDLTPIDVQHYLADVRELFRREIRAQLSQTVSRSEELEEEWNAFFAS
jgi:RNA polymerase sigma-70 factor (ECF subfamily)